MQAAKGAPVLCLDLSIAVYLHVAVRAEIGLALHDVAANQLPGILGSLRHPGGCVAHQDAGASLNARQVLQTGATQSPSHLVMA